MAEKKTIELDVQSNIGSLKSQLREAQAEVAKMADQFGATSEEASKAAKKAAELKDRIGDAKNLTDAFNPEAKFASFGQAINAASGAFTAFEGAMGLAGVESEALQKQLLKVQSAMAITQGLEALGGLGDAFKNVKTVAVDAFKSIKGAIGSTGIGLLVIALATIVTYWDDIKAAVGGVSEEQKKINATTAKNLEVEKSKLTALNNQDNVLKLQGKSEKEILQLKINQLAAVISKTKADIKSKEITADLEYKAAKRNYEITKNVIRGAMEFGAVGLRLLVAPIDMVLKTANKVSEALGFGKITALDLNAEITKLNKWGSESVSKFLFDPAQTKIDSQKDIQASRDSLLVMKNDLDGFKLQIKDLNNKSNEDTNKNNSDSRDQDLENIAEYQKNATDLFKEEYDKQVRDITEKYDAQIALAKKYDKDTTDLEAAKAKELKDLADHQIDTTRLGLEKVAMLQVTHLDHTKEMQEQEKKGLVGVAEVKERIALRDKELDEEQKQRQKDKLDLALKYAQTFGQTMGSLNSLLNAQDNERLKSVKKGSKEEDAIKRKMFERDKKLRIVQTIIDTASNVVNSVRNGGGIPTGIPFGIAAGAMGALQIAAINKAKYDGGSSSVESSMGGGGAGAGSVMSPSFNVVGNSGINQLAQLQQQPTKAYVVSGDVTSAQSLDRNRIENATLVQ